MRIGVVCWLAVVLAGGLSGPMGTVLAQSRDVPTPATPGPNPGAAATDAVVNPVKPNNLAPSSSGASDPAPAAGSAAPAPPAATPPSPSPPTGRPMASGSPPIEEMHELVEAARETAKAARENVSYSRVVPDILTQILAKLDKLEDKLDKVENAVKGSGQRARR